MKRWSKWLRECPLWYKPIWTRSDITYTVAVKSLDLSSNCSWETGERSGQLTASWNYTNSYDQKVIDASCMRIVLVVPDDVVE